MLNASVFMFMLVIYLFRLEDLKGRGHSEDLGLDVKIILEW